MGFCGAGRGGACYEISFSPSSPIPSQKVSFRIMTRRRALRAAVAAFFAPGHRGHMAANVHVRLSLSRARSLSSLALALSRARSLSSLAPALSLSLSVPLPSLSVCLSVPLLSLWRIASASTWCQHRPCRCRPSRRAGPGWPNRRRRTRGRRTRPGCTCGEQEINHKEINYNGPKEAPISKM